MNEIMFRKYVKQVIGCGVPKLMALDIVKTAMEASKGKNVEMYINYAVNLTYGFNFSTNAK